MVGCWSSTRPTCSGSSTSSRSTHPTAATSTSAIRATPSARRARSARSRCSSCPATRRRRGWRPRPSTGASTRRAIRGRGLGAVRARSASGRPADAPPGTPLRHAGGQRRPRVRRAVLAHALRRARRSPRATLPPFRVALLSPGDRNQWYSASRRLRARARPRHRARAAQGLRHHRRAGRDGREPRRAGDAARAAPLPAPLRRALPAVGQLLHAALRRAGERLRALRAHHPLRARHAARRPVRDAGPGDDHRRPRGGERRQQPRRWRVRWRRRGTT